MSIEIQYQKFLKRKKDSNHRYLKLNQNQTIDFKQMGILENKKGDGSASKSYNFGSKTPSIQIRRGRYYDDLGRENTVKDGDLEITMTALQTLQTTTDKTGIDLRSG